MRLSIENQIYKKLNFVSNFAKSAIPFEYNPCRPKNVITSTLPDTERGFPTRTSSEFENELNGNKVCYIGKIMPTCIE